MQFCIYTCMIVISWLGAKAIIASGNDPALGLTTGNLTALITYAMQILSSLMMLSMVFAMLTISLSSARRIAEVLEERSDIPQPEQPVMTVRDGAVDFDHVSFKYSAHAKRQALDNIDLHIKSGETIGIIGGTGSAKSTLVNLIARLYDTTEGTVRVGGVDVRRYRLEALRNQVAVVLQKNVLFSGTIKENLRWGHPDATDEEVAEAARMVGAEPFIRNMKDGYQADVGEGGNRLSTGQKQLISFARAILTNPSIFVLDEAPSSVDTETEQLIQHAIQKVLAGRTSFIIAHRLSTIRSADRILVIQNG